MPDDQHFEPSTAALRHWMERQAQLDEGRAPLRGSGRTVELFGHVYRWRAERIDGYRLHLDRQPDWVPAEVVHSFPPGPCARWQARVGEAYVFDLIGGRIDA